MPVTADAPDTSLRGLYSGMVVRLNAAGVPDYVTYLGGGGGGTALRSVIVSGSQVYVGGETASTDFATSPLIAGLPPSARSAGNTDAFVARLRHDTGALDFARYFGGSGADTILALAIDASGQLHATGFTSSPDLPGAPPGNQFRGVNDAFILKLNVAATGPVYFRYLGGSLFDIAYGVSIDSGGAAHVAGSTSSADFPTLAPFQPRLSNFTGFYARLNGQGDIEQSSPVGGSADSSAFSAARQPQSGIVWIAGGTSAPPPAPPADNANAGGTDGFVASLDPASPALRSWTFVGGNSFDTIYRIFPSADGSLIVAGRTSSPDFPATRSLRNGVAGSEDVFVARLAPRPAAQPDLRVLLRDSRDPVSPGDRFDLEVTVVNDGPGSASGVAVELTLPPGLTPILPLPTGWTLGGATMRYALGGLDASRASPPLTLPVQCAAAGTHTTSVRVVATEPDRDPANDRRDETTSCGAPNLLVTVEAVDFVTGQPPGRRLFHDGPVRFRLVARNIGQGPANGVALTSARPAGCTPLNPGDADELILPTLAAGAAASLTVSMRCPAGLHVNVARVAAANESPAEASDGNTASATVQVEVRPLLRIALDFAPNEMRVGQFVRFAPVIENIGTVAAEDVRVLISFVGEDRAVLSAMIDFPGSVCTATNFALPQVRIECRAGTLAPGEVRYVVRLDGDGRAPGSIRVNSAAEAQDGRAVGDIRGFVVRP
jgi:hypothetical protein